MIIVPLPDSPTQADITLRYDPAAPPITYEMVNQSGDHLITGGFEPAATWYALMTSYSEFGSDYAAWAGKVRSVIQSIESPPSVFPVKDTLLSQACVGVDKVGTYADGTGGTYTAFIEKNSTSCGYNPPAEPPPETPPVNIPGSDAFPKTARRRYNPLGNFSSSTYQITLYMVTPDEYERFKDSSRRTINTAPGAGGFIVAQSGGINNTSSTRAPGFKLDYYLDNLKMVAAISPGETGAPAITTSMTFDVTEPYGFSFITNLRRASDSIKATSKIKNIDNLANASKQLFILGVRFQGYDSSGKVVSGATTFAQDTGGVPASGVFERLYAICITSMKFKLDGKAPVYHCTASVFPQQVSLGTKRGRINNDVVVKARTVAEAIGGAPAGPTTDHQTNGVLDVLNKTQEELVASGQATAATVYKVVWLGDAEETIASQTIVSPADVDKSRFPMGAVPTTIQSNEAVADSSTPDPTRRTITFKDDTSIIQAIGSIIAQSGYITNALTKIPKSAEESNSLTDSDGTAIVNDTKVPLRWFNLSAEIRVLQWDPKQSDFVYEITYIVQPYDIPSAISTYGNKPVAYYGPHKRYDYWYTGHNSEVLEYQQSLDNLWYITGLSDAEPYEIANTGNVAVIPNQRSLGNQQGYKSTGSYGPNSVVANLNDPVSYIKAKIKIMGDPDFLMQENVGVLTETYDQFYGSDGSIKPTGGEIYIEIDFKEARDYAKADGTENGLMDINSDIVFWTYPPELQAMVHGVSYRVIGVTSTFVKGTFVQELQTVVNTFPNFVPTNINDPAADAASQLVRAGRRTSPSDNLDSAG